MADTQRSRPDRWPVDGGEMGIAIRSLDWSATPLGPVLDWPQSLRSVVDLVLASPLPMSVLWGPALIQLYNDGYRRLIGEKHPAGLGQPASECWPEAWDVCGPICDDVLRGEARSVRDQQLARSRHRAGEDARLDLTFSPVRNEAGAVAGVLVTVTEATDQGRDADAVRESAVMYRTLLDSVDEGFDVVDLMYDDNGNAVDYRFVEVNPAFAEMTGISGDVVGKTAREIDPTLDASWFEMLGDVATTGAPVRFENQVASLGRHFDVFATRVGGANSRRLAIVFTDITERKRAEQERERLLREVDVERERLAEIVEQAPSLMVVFSGADHVFEYANRYVYEWYGRHDIIGLPVREALRDIALDSFYDMLDAVYRTGERFVATSAPVAPKVQPPEGRYVDVAYQALRDAGGTITGVIGQEVDVTGRVRAERALRESEERQAFLLELGDALRTVSDAVDVQAEITRLLGQHLGASRTYYVEYDEAEGHATVARDYVADSSPSLAGRYGKETYRTVLSRIGDGRTWVMPDVVADAELARDERELLARQHVVAWIDVPLVKQGHLVAILCVTQTTAREWTDFEVALVEEIAERTWSAVERARAEAALRESEARQAFLLRLSDVVRSLDDPAAIEGASARMLGERLSADHVYLCTIDEDANVAEVGRDYVANGAPSLAGQYRASDFSAIVSLLRAGRPLVVEDVANNPRLPVESGDRTLRPSFRAVVAVPIFSNGTLVAMLVVGESEARAWSGDEVRLVEESAARIWPDLARSRAQRALRDSEERQAYLLALSDALRPLADPGEIQNVAMRVLGEHLGILRAQYFEIDPNDEYFLSAGGYTNGAPPVVHAVRMDDLGTFVKEAFRSGQVLAVADAAADPRVSEGELAAYDALGFRSFIGVPLVKGGRFVAGIGIHHGEPRDWRQAEVALAEETAERTWAAVERARAEAALANSQERLQLSLDASAMGTFVWYPQDDRGEPDARMRELFGLRGEGALNLAVALGELIHPDDRARFQDAIARALEPDGTGMVQEDIRVVQPDAAVTWLTIYGQVYFDGVPRRAVRMAGMAADITQHKRAEAAREQARREAEEAVRARDEFLSIASHELRNPVASIKGSAQLLKRSSERGRLDARRIERYMTTVIDASDRLATLVSDLLDVSRLEAGKMPINRRPTDLATLVGETVTEERISGMGRRVRVDLQDGQAVALDAERIRQVIVNLLENAIKYSAESGAVRVLLSHDGEGALLRVQDHGIGLPQDALESIFAPFGRASNAAESNLPGMGLGLYICRRIVEAHGGRLWAESEGEGRGTTMSLWLPLGDTLDDAPTTSRAGGG